MNLSCPACGAEMTLDVLIGHESAREAVLHALQLPPALARLLMQYLSLFRPPQRQLSWARVATILAELREPIAAAQIERGGRAFTAPVEYWRAAIEQMIQLRDQGKLQLPLKSHGYLFEIIAAQSGKAEAKAEAAREKNPRAGATSDAQAPRHGFAQEQMVLIVSGELRGWSGRIYSLMPSFACLEDLVNPEGEKTTRSISLPYSHLKPLSQP